MWLRRAELVDMPAVAGLHRTTMRTSLPYLPDLHTAEADLTWFSEHLYPTSTVWLAEDDGVLAGYMAVKPGWLDHLYVRPDQQGRGVGGLLIGQAMADATSLQLWTFQRNVRARVFYERRGFALILFRDGAENEEREPDALYRWTRGGEITND